jgi:hypothetical protein
VAMVERLYGEGDVVTRLGQTIGRARYRIRVIYPSGGPSGRVGQVAAMIAVNPTVAERMSTSGRVTLRLEDSRELDFLLLSNATAGGFVPVASMSALRPAHHPSPAI